MCFWKKKIITLQPSIFFIKIKSFWNDSESQELLRIVVSVSVLALTFHHSFPQ